MGKSEGTVLVTGGAGFIGSHLVPRLLEKGYSVTVLDTLCSGKMENLTGLKGKIGFKFILGDILDKKVLQEAFYGVNAVVHLAALIDVSASVIDPLETHEINVTGTLNLLQAATKNEVERFIFASSTAVYGNAQALPIKETAILMPISPYSASKVAGEAYCNAFTDCYDLDAIVLRFFNVYGPRNSNSPYSGVITKFLQKIRSNEILTIEGDGKQTRDFIHVSDVAEALVLALENKQLKGEVLNVCTGIPTSVNQLVDLLSYIAGKNLRAKHISPRQGDIRESFGDPTAALEKLGFKSKVSLHKGLEMLLQT
jgi:UDP-glucose 4-epimerase